MAAPRPDVFFRIGDVGEASSTLLVSLSSPWSCSSLMTEPSVTESSSSWSRVSGPPSSSPSSSTRRRWPSVLLPLRLGGEPISAVGMNGVERASRAGAAIRELHELCLQRVQKATGANMWFRGSIGLSSGTIAFRFRRGTESWSRSTAAALRQRKEARGCQTQELEASRSRRDRAGRKKAISKRR